MSRTLMATAGSVAACMLLVVAWPQSNARAETPESLVAAVVEGSAFAIMRHALAPGTGDPVNFDVNDCSTQRNLSESGRQQAIRTGERLRSLGLNTASVFSSAWCRCKETAELLNLGPVTVLPALNSFFEDRAKGPAQTQSLKNWLETERPDGPLLMVTHQVNISGLTGEFTTSGEIIVARLENDGSVTTLGSID